MTESSLKSLNDNRVSEFLKLTRVAHLATADNSGMPHNVPLCFWYDEAAHFYFVIDLKPKRMTGAGLKRMRNMAENPQVALIVDTNFTRKRVTSNNFYNHFNLTNTLEAAFGLPCLNHACDPQSYPMADLFQR